MPEPLRMLLVGQSLDELLALRAVVTRLVSPAVELFAVQADSASTDPELAWGRRRLELRRLALDGAELEPDVHELLGSDGDVWQAVVGAAQRHRVDLIAITSHPQSWIRRLLKGSSAADVVEHSGVPVLTVPDAAIPERRRGT